MTDSGTAASERTRHVTASVQIKEWEPDGETTYKAITLETTGGFGRLPWSQYQCHGHSPTERELTLMARIQDAISELVELSEND